MTIIQVRRLQLFPRLNSLSPPSSFPLMSSESERLLKIFPCLLPLPSAQASAHVTLWRCLLDDVFNHCMNRQARSHCIWRDGAIGWNLTASVWYVQTAKFSQPVKHVKRHTPGWIILLLSIETRIIIDIGGPTPGPTFSNLAPTRCYSYLNVYLYKDRCFDNWKPPQFQSISLCQWLHLQTADYSLTLFPQVHYWLTCFHTSVWCPSSIIQVILSQAKRLYMMRQK